MVRRKLSREVHFKSNLEVDQLQAIVRYSLHHPGGNGMLSNDDLAELIESTRDRVRHMGGDTPAGAGIIQVLNGLITVLRDQVAAEAPAAETEPQEEFVPSESP